MIVHNVYSDILFFISNTLNSILSGSIQEFKYNIGNASFVLNYNPNYSLPNAIVNFIAVNPFNTRMNTFHKVLTNNVYLIPVLYDRDKDLKLELQEDLYYIDISVNINCESQLHAIELKHNLENFLPTGKLLNYKSFCSFYEIDEVFLNKYLFDVNNDDIDNLFLIHNKLSDRMTYCFSTEYTPLIRLESIDLNINDITSATFTVSTNFKILTHIPSKLIFNKPLLKNYNSIHLLRHDNKRIPVNKDYDYYLLNNDILIHKNKIENIINYNDTYEFEIEKDIKYTETGEFHCLLENKHINGKIVIDHFENSNFSVRIFTFDDYVNGFVKDVEFLDDNNIKGLYFPISNTNSAAQEIYLIYNIFKKNQLIKIKEINNNYNVKFHEIIVPNEIYSVIKNVNRFKAEINYEETKILGFNDVILNNNISLNSNGEFEFSFENLYLIKGIIDLKSGNINILNILNYDDLTENNDLIIYHLNANIVFTIFEIRGSGYIENIVLDINSTFNNSISTVSVINNDYIDYGKKIKNIIVDKINFIKKENDIVTFSIFNNIDLLLDNNTNFSFYFTKFNRLISNKANFIIHDNNKLVFTCSNLFYYENLDSVNNIHPLILKIGL
jgi:hypothetical protein